MASVFDVLSQLGQQAQPRPDLITPGSLTQDLSIARPFTYQGRVGYPGQSLTDIMGQMPTQSAEEGSKMLPGLVPTGVGVGVAGMAKQMKPGPTTVEGLVSHLAATGTTLPSRGSMRPSIHVPALNETFAGDLGGIHPTDLVNQTLQRRGIPSGGYLFGYTPTYEGAPFVGGELAGYLGVPGGAKTVQGLLNRGIKLNVIEDLLRQGQVPMPR